MVRLSRYGRLANALPAGPTARRREPASSRLHHRVPGRHRLASHRSDFSLSVAVAVARATQAVAIAARAGRAERSGNRESGELRQVVQFPMEVRSPSLWGRAGAKTLQVEPPALCRAQQRLCRPPVALAASKQVLVPVPEHRQASPALLQPMGPTVVAL